MAEAKEKAKKVKPRDMITVAGTGKSKFLEKGKEVRVHKVAAEKLIKKGFATKAADKAKPAKDDE